MNAMPMTASWGTQRILYLGSGPEDSLKGAFGRNNSTAEGLIHHGQWPWPGDRAHVLTATQSAGIVGQPAKDYSPSPIMIPTSHCYLNCECFQN